MTAFALDSSTVLTWVLQEQRWRSVEKMLHSPGAEPLLPGPDRSQHRPSYRLSDWRAAWTSWIA